MGGVWLRKLSSFMESLRLLFITLQFDCIINQNIEIKRSAINLSRLQKPIQKSIKMSLAIIMQGLLFEPIAEASVRNA